jgi:hypothetical protein
MKTCFAVYSLSDSLPSKEYFASVWGNFQGYFNNIEDAYVFAKNLKTDCATIVDLETGEKVWRTPLVIKET